MKYISVLFFGIVVLLASCKQQAELVQPNVVIIFLDDSGSDYSR